MMGIKEIQEIIPHRHPFLLIDCIEEVTPGEGAVGYKNVYRHRGSKQWTLQELEIPSSEPYAVACQGIWI